MRDGRQLPPPAPQVGETTRGGCASLAILSLFCCADATAVEVIIWTRHSFAGLPATPSWLAVCAACWLHLQLTKRAHCICLPHLLPHTRTHHVVLAAGQQIQVADNTNFVLHAPSYDSGTPVSGGLDNRLTWWTSRFCPTPAALQIYSKYPLYLHVITRCYISKTPPINLQVQILTGYPVPKVTNQLWEHTTDFTLKLTGTSKCMEVRAAGGVGAAVQVADCGSPGESSVKNAASGV